MTGRALAVGAIGLAGIAAGLVLAPWVLSRWAGRVVQGRQR